MLSDLDSLELQSPLLDLFLLGGLVIPKQMKNTNTHIKYIEQLYKLYS